MNSFVFSCCLNREISIRRRKWSTWENSHSSALCGLWICLPVEQTSNSFINNHPNPSLLHYFYHIEAFIFAFEYSWGCLSKQFYDWVSEIYIRISTTWTEARNVKEFQECHHGTDKPDKDGFDMLGTVAALCQFKRNTKCSFSYLMCPCFSSIMIKITMACNLRQSVALIH